MRVVAYQTFEKNNSKKLNEILRIYFILWSLKIMKLYLYFSREFEGVTYVLNFELIKFT